MKRGKILWGTFALTLCCFILAAVQVRRRERQPEPPYEKSDAHVVWAIYEAYTADESEADKWFKGKVLALIDCHISYTKPRIRPNGSGESFVSMYKNIGSSKHPIEREVIRCYLHRPNEPVMERGKRHLPFGAQAFDIKGVCMGKIGGMIVMRKCYLVETSVEGS